MAKCCGCGLVRTPSNSTKSKRNEDGLDDYCRDCKSRQYHKNSKSIRNAFLQRRYGITQLDFEKLAKLQGNRCAICRTKNPGNTGCSRFKRSTWHVDHVHGTKHVRGLLCHLCNRMLGLAKDNSKTLASAIQYLLRGENT